MLIKIRSWLRLIIQNDTEQMEETHSQTCVKTFLKCSKQAKQEIEEVVQLRSRVESYGNCVFTLAILLQFKKTGYVSEKLCSQSAVSAAMRAVCCADGFVDRRHERFASFIQMHWPPVDAHAATRSRYVPAESESAEACTNGEPTCYINIGGVRPFRNKIPQPSQDSG